MGRRRMTQQRQQGEGRGTDKSDSASSQSDGERETDAPFPVTRRGCVTTCVCFVCVAFLVWAAGAGVPSLGGSNGVHRNACVRARAVSCAAHTYRETDSETHAYREGE